MEQLLKILEDNARLPIEDIATMLNKSPAEVAAMIDLARAQGIIKGYKTLVDWEKAGVNRVEAVIELNVSPKKSRGFDEIAATIAAFDEVESVLLMSGGYDLQLVIKGQTFQEIALFVAKRLSPLDDVLSTATHFVLRTYKKEGRFSWIPWKRRGMRGITERRLRLRPPPLVLSFRPVYRSFCMRRLHRFPASSLCWGAWDPAS